MGGVASLKAAIPLTLKKFLVQHFRAQELALPPPCRAFVLLAADYGNIGDLAITAAQQKFLELMLPSHHVVPIPISATRKVIRSLCRQVAPSDLVTIIGGGNMGSLYPDIEELRQLVIRSFPRNRIVCFPQTLDWDDSDRSQLTIDSIVRVYGQHPDLYIFARESVTFKKLCELFRGQPSIKVGLVPDIVLSATAEDLGARGGAEPRGALLCLRNDRERSLSDEHAKALQRALLEAQLQTELTDTHAGGSRLPPDRCAWILADKLAQFERARLVVTDRLHGMILAVLAGTPCLVIPNSNHKISQTWQDWLADVPQVRFLKVVDLPTVGTAIRELLAVPRRAPALPVINPSQFAALVAAVRS